MTKKAMFVVIVVSMLSVLCAACGSCPEGAKVVDGYCVNGSGQRVESIKPDFSQIQESAVGQAAGSTDASGKLTITIPSNVTQVQIKANLGQDSGELDLDFASNS